MQHSKLQIIREVQIKTSEKDVTLLKTVKTATAKRTSSERGWAHGHREALSVTTAATKKNRCENTASDDLPRPATDKQRQPTVFWQADEQN